MEQELREILDVIGGIMPDFISTMTHGLGLMRNGLMENGFTRDEAVQIVIAQAGSGEQLIHLKS